MSFITVKEFAEKTRLSPATIRRAIKAGKITAFRPGAGKKSPHRIPEIEIERLMAEEIYLRNKEEK